MLSPQEKQSFKESYLDPLQALLGELQQEKLSFDEIDLDHQWFRELKDGFEILLLRVEYIERIYRFILDHNEINEGNQGEFDLLVGRLNEILTQGKAIVINRHGQLHDVLQYQGSSIFNQRVSNPTIYDYGYLFFNTNLCYWNRELQLMYKYYRMPATIQPCF